MSVQWNALMNQPNPGMQAVQGFQQGMQLKQQREMQAMQMQGLQEDREHRRAQAEAQQRRQQLEGAREQLGITARLLESATDPISYQQARQAAAGIPGFDASKVPEQYDPNWVAQTQMQVRALSGKVDEELVVIDGVAMGKQSGQPKFESPYDRVIPGPDGSFYTVPRHGYGRGGQQGPQQGQVVQGNQLPQGWSYDDEGWSYDDEGDASGNAGGGFLDPLAPL
jgi:hypothetical protein